MPQPSILLFSYKTLPEKNVFFHSLWLSDRTPLYYSVSHTYRLKGGGGWGPSLFFSGLTPTTHLSSSQTYPISNGKDEEDVTSRSVNKRTYTHTIPHVRKRTRVSHVTYGERRGRKIWLRDAICVGSRHTCFSPPKKRPLDVGTHCMPLPVCCKRATFHIPFPQVPREKMEGIFLQCWKYKTLVSRTFKWAI